MEFFGLDLSLWIAIIAVSLLLCAAFYLHYTWHRRVLSRQRHYYEKILNNMLDGFVLHSRDGKDHFGKACDNVGVNWDVTNQAENLRILQEAREEVAISLRTKNEFLANMSHEIRTPLNGVFGMLGLLKDTKLNEEQTDLLATAQSCGEHLLAILNDLLDFNRIEAGRLTLDYEPFDVHTCVIEVVKLMSSLAQKKRLRIVTEVVPDLPVMNLGDEVRFRQILINLMSNAIKFTLHGEIRIQVDGFRDSQNKFAFRISVHDTGIGISRENQAKIFQAFSQVETSMSRRFGGTGLGLAISSRLAQLMGGTLGMQSEAGQGSSFTLAVSLEIVTPQKNLQLVPAGAEANHGQRIRHG